MRRWSPLWLVGLALAACAPKSHAQADAAAPTASTEQSLPPVGYGTLDQSNLAIRLVVGTDLDIRFVPLDERVLRLLAPDAYRSLHSLVTTYQPQIDSLSSQAGVSRPGLVLVSFFAQQPNVRFSSQLVQVTARNRVYLPVASIPFNAAFGAEQLSVRTQAIGILLFEEPLPVYEPITFGYGTQSTDEWTSRLRVIDRERARIAARALSSRPDADSTSEP